ncbi:MAG: hypothetical protein IJ087_14780 [Eggerthellaceae bacterium]|nr:hypothetical protein [Eggerthellaceae bacterium]
MAAFAAAADYRALYDTELADARLDALLARASRDMAAELRAAGIGYADPEGEFAEDLRDVACSIVHRSVGDDAAGLDVPFGVTQFSQSAGGYSASATLGNPYGDFFMTEAERRKLGIGLPRARVLSPY